MGKTFVSNTLTDPGLIALEERTEVLDGYNLPNPLYVSPDGSDETGDGTEQKPFRQIQHAIDQVPKGINVWKIYIDGGTYNPILIGRKDINLYLKGDVTIQARENTIERAIEIQRSFVYITSDIGSQVGERKLYTKGCSVSLLCVNIADVNINKYVELNIVNTVKDTTYDSVICCNLHCKVNMNCNILQSGTINASRFFFVNTNSFLMWYQIDQVTSNVGQITNTMNTFATSGAGSILTIKVSNPNLTISNNYQRGINADAGIAILSNMTNNAQIPYSQYSGGRVFTPQNYSATNTNASSSSSSSVDNEIYIEDIESNDLNFYDFPEPK